MQKPLITPKQAAAVNANVVASLRPLTEYLRRVGPAAMAASGKAGHALKESFNPPT